MMSQRMAKDGLEQFVFRSCAERVKANVQNHCDTVCMQAGGSKSEDIVYQYSSVVWKIKNVMQIAFIRRLALLQALVERKSFEVTYGFEFKQ